MDIHLERNSAIKEFKIKDYLKMNVWILLTHFEKIWRHGIEYFLGKKRDNVISLYLVLHALGITHKALWKWHYRQKFSEGLALILSRANENEFLLRKVCSFSVRHFRVGCYGVTSPTLKCLSNCASSAVFSKSRFLVQISLFYSFTRDSCLFSKYHSTLLSLFWSLLFIPDRCPL